MITDLINTTNDIPVAVAFTDNGAFYFYDAYYNHILKVNKAQYVEINSLLQLGLKAYENLKRNTQAYYDVTSLILKGYFRPAWIEQVKHPDTDLLEDILSRGLQQLTLQVTHNCNFKCRYCLYSRESGIDRIHNKAEMSWDTAKKSIDFLYEHSKDSMSINISFYGGEPLLNFKLIKECVNYVEKLFKTKVVTFNMTTNGSIITDEIIDFLSSKGFYLTISLDGPPDIQNYNRKFGSTGYDTFNIVWDNIVHINERNPNWFSNNVYFNPVYLGGENPEKIIDFFRLNSINTDKVHLNFANLSGVDFFSTSQNIYLTNKSTIMPFQEKLYGDFETNITDSRTIPSIWHHGGPCAPGGRKIFVDINGILFPCEKLNCSIGNSIGNISDGINTEKATSFLNIGTLTEHECKNCYAIRFCDICMQKCYNPESETIDASQKRLQCEKKKKTILHFMKYFVSRR